MSFLYRLGYFLGGFSAGLVILFFLFNGKRTQCNYGPQARVINNLSEKNKVPQSGLNFIVSKDFEKNFLLLCGFEKFRDFYNILNHSFFLLFDIHFHFRELETAL